MRTLLLAAPLLFATPTTGQLVIDSFDSGPQHFSVSAPHEFAGDSALGLPDVVGGARHTTLQAMFGTGPNTLDIGNGSATKVNAPESQSLATFTYSVSSIDWPSFQYIRIEGTDPWLFTTELTDDLGRSSVVSGPINSWVSLADGVYTPGQQPDVSKIQSMTIVIFESWTIDSIEIAAVPEPHRAVFLTALTLCAFGLGRLVVVQTRKLSFFASPVAPT